MEVVYDIDYERGALVEASYVLLATPCPLVAQAIWAGRLRVYKARGKEDAEQALAYLAPGTGLVAVRGCIGEVVGAYRSVAHKHPEGENRGGG